MNTLETLYISLTKSVFFNNLLVKMVKRLSITGYELCKLLINNLLFLLKNYFIYVFLFSWIMSCVYSILRIVYGFNTRVVVLDSYLTNYLDRYSDTYSAIFSITLRLVCFFLSVFCGLVFIWYILDFYLLFSIIGKKPMYTDVLSNVANFEFQIISKTNLFYFDYKNKNDSFESIFSIFVSGDDLFIHSRRKRRDFGFWRLARTNVASDLAPLDHSSRRWPKVKKRRYGKLYSRYGVFAKFFIFHPKRYKLSFWGGELPNSSFRRYSFAFDPIRLFKINSTEAIPFKKLPKVYTSYYLYKVKLMHEYFLNLHDVYDYEYEVTLSDTVGDVRFKISENRIFLDQALTVKHRRKKRSGRKLALKHAAVVSKHLVYQKSHHPEFRRIWDFNAWGRRFKYGNRINPVPHLNSNKYYWHDFVFTKTWGIFSNNNNFYKFSDDFSIRIERILLFPDETIQLLELAALESKNRVHSTKLLSNWYPRVPKKFVNMVESERPMHFFRVKSFSMVWIASSEIAIIFLVKVRYVFLFLEYIRIYFSKYVVFCLSTSKNKILLNEPIYIFLNFFRFFLEFLKFILFWLILNAFTPCAGLFPLPRGLIEHGFLNYNRLVWLKSHDLFIQTNIAKNNIFVNPIEADVIRNREKLIKDEADYEFFTRIKNSHDIASTNYISSFPVCEDSYVRRHCESLKQQFLNKKN